MDGVGGFGVLATPTAFIDQLGGHPGHERPIRTPPARRSGTEEAEPGASILPRSTTEIALNCAGFFVGLLIMTGDYVAGRTVAEPKNWEFLASPTGDGLDLLGGRAVRFLGHHRRAALALAVAAADRLSTSAERARSA